MENRMKMLERTLIAAALLVWQSGGATIGPTSQDPMPVFTDGARILFQGDSITDGNRGISGNTVSALARRWQTDTIDLKPDILSILIGVNDLSFGVPAERYEQQHDQLLADTMKGLPNVRLVLCEPFGLPVAREEG